MLHSMLHAARAKVHNNRAGFTLIELLVVIVLLGILMAVAVPTFQNAQESGQAAAAQGELRTAYELASGAYTSRADGTYPSTADLLAELEASEDELDFETLGVTLPKIQAVEAATQATPPLENIDAPTAGKVGVVVFNCGADCNTTGAATAAGAGTSVLLARMDESRDNVVWWIVSNKDEAATTTGGTTGDMVGAYYGASTNRQGNSSEPVITPAPEWREG